MNQCYVTKAIIKGFVTRIKTENKIKVRKGRLQEKRLLKKISNLLKNVLDI